MKINLKKKFISDIELKNKRIIIRVDFNVPITNDGKIIDTRRIDMAIPTLKYIMDNNVKNIIIISHLGRPNGKIDQKLSLKPIKHYLESILKKDVYFLDNCIGKEIKEFCNIKNNGSIILLENLRFHPEEECKNVNNKDIEKFRNNLSELGDIYVNDAFGTSHRSHSSIVGIKLKMKVGGFLLKKELEYFSKVLLKPKKPFISILGGSKVSDKIKLINNLLEKVDEMIIGGGMAFTFLKVLNNMKIGSSIFDLEGSKLVKSIMKKAKNKNVKIHLPNDFIIADSFSNNAKIDNANINDGIKLDWLGLDIGPESIKRFSDIIYNSKMIVWNGPMGVFEFDKFEDGTKQLLKSCSKATKENDTITIIGGGDTASAANKFCSESDFSHISTGGGASLELLEGKILPGIEILTDKNS